MVCMFIRQQRVEVTYESLVSTKGIAHPLREIGVRRGGVAI